MANKNAESSQPQVQQQHGEAGGLPAPPPSGQADPRSRGGNTIFKSGPLFISSKGIGWTSWKKRWFILTRTSLVFFRSDPSAIPQKGSEVNLTLGGIDLNNSGSVVVKADKKLLTVLFPDGRDGRTFTLKAETMEDLYEWKTALENALTQAPSASHVMGQNGILRNEQGDAANGSAEKANDTMPVRSTVIGTPILLALEDVDGAPSFLEKALRFVEDRGVKVEGILRQAADVDDVERRIREYEQGKNEFSTEEDAHVIADCVKYVLRELPSSPVPASCCNALLEACRADRGSRVNAMRAAICETFPEPNRRLLQRILMMMQTVASHKTVNRMSTSAVAACMAPLLLRPLLAGDCEIENDFDVGGDGSIQLLQAAAAANHAQAIVITLLEEYDSIFGEGSLSPDLYSDTEDSGSETDEATDDDEYDDDATQGSEEYTDDDDDDIENASNGTCSESGISADNEVDNDDSDDKKVSDGISSESKSPKESSELKVSKKLSSNSRRASLPRRDDVEKKETIPNKSSDNSETQETEDFSTELNKEKEIATLGPVSCVQKSSTLSDGPGCSKRLWGRTPAKKNLSMESIDFPVEEEDVEIQRLESTKLELQNRIAEEVKSNAVLQASLERRKKALHERRLALENYVARLQEQLQKERDKRAALEAGLNMSQGTLSFPEAIDEKVKRDLQEVAQAEKDITKLEEKVDNLEDKLGQQNVKSLSSTHDSSNTKLKDKQKDTEAAATATLGFERPPVKDTHWEARETEVEKQRDSTSLQSKHSRQNQQQDLSLSNSKSAGMTGSSSKRSGTRGEGTNSTTSALSKLTTRLNFLKERRSQIANELQNMDKGRSPNQGIQISDKGRASDNTQSLHDPETGAVPEGESLPNSERSKKSSSNKPNQDPDGGKRSEGQSPHILDRGKSENNMPYTSEKACGSGGNSNTTTRTFSR